MSLTSQSHTMTSTPNPASTQKEIANQDKTKSWSQIGSTELVTRSSNTVTNKTTRIRPECESKSNRYERIVITSTHFTNKPYRGFIKDEETEIISKAVGLHNLDNHDGTSFYRSKKVFFLLYTNWKETFGLTKKVKQEILTRSVDKLFPHQWRKAVKKQTMNQPSTEGQHSRNIDCPKEVRSTDATMKWVLLK